ncbi:MAG: DUF4153 domain-containing protein [Saprospiraceae bacterium]
MKIPSLGFLLNAFLQACRRFPGTMLCAFVGVGALLILIDNDDQEKILAPLWMVCQLGLPLLTGIVVFSESKGWSEKRGWLLQGLGLAALAGYYFLLDVKAPGFEYVGLPRFFTLLIVAHLFVAVAPYMNRRSVKDFWEYNRELFANIIIGAVFTLILFAGLALAILAVDQLFDLDIDEKNYVRLFVVLAGIFNTSYFLFHFPKNYEFEADEVGYHVVFKNLCKYILIPIVALYFLILYAYGGKILGTWNLPKGWVSSLVLGFSVAGIFTYLLNFYLPEHDDSAHVKGYKKWFWWIVLPLTVLLFVAIGRRISDYGVTEERFLVAHLGVWLAATCLYFLISKHDNIKFIPISLALFALVFAFGPLNAFKVSEQSQEKILTNLFEKNGRWKDGRLAQGTSEIPKEDAEQIISALEFLDRRDALRRMEWLPMPLDSFPRNLSTYNDATRVADWAGISSVDQRGYNYLAITAEGLETAGLNVRGFSTFYPLRLNKHGDEKPEQGYFFTLSDDNTRLEWQQVKSGKINLVESFDLQPTLKKWAAQSQEFRLLLSPNESFLDFVSKKGSIRFVVTKARIEKENGGLKLEYLNGYLFLKEK